MRPKPFAARIALLALALALSAAVAAAGPAKKGPTPAAAAGELVRSWLVLGPAAAPLPAFHDAEVRGYGVRDLLEAAPSSDPLASPAAGDEESWLPGATLAWRRVETGPDGLAALDSGGEPGKVPAVARLVAYVRTERYRKLDVEVLGAHPRALRLDGGKVVSGGVGGDAATASGVRGTLELTPGTHRLEVPTVRDPGRDAAWSVGLRIEPGEDGAAPGLVVTTDPERDLTILDVVDAAAATSIDVSPDGDLVAMSLARTVPGTDDRETWVEVRRAADGAGVGTWRGSFGMTDVAWAPTGHRLTYVTSDGAEAKTSTLWLADLDAGTVAPLLERTERLDGYAWSPTGDAIAYWTSVEPPKDETGIKRLREIRDRWNDFRTKSYLHLLTLPDGARHRLTAGPETASFQAFAPDGRRLLFSRDVEDVSRRPYTRSQLWEIDLDTFAARELREFGWLYGAQYAPDGRRLLIRAGPSAFDRVGADLPDDVVPNDYDGQLFVWDPATDAVDPITKSFDPAVTDAVWCPADGAVHLLAADGDRVKLFTWNPATRTFSPRDSGVDVVSKLAVARRVAVAAVYGTSPWTPQVVSAVDLASGRVTTLLRPAASRFARVRTGEVRDFAFEASSGVRIDGRFYLPPDFDPARKYPLIVYYYGGTLPIERDFGGRYPKEWWAAQGFVVYVPQPSGAYGYGQAFSARHVDDWGRTTAGEIVEGAKKFLEAHPFVDPKRVGCIGASYGGFMTMTLVTARTCSRPRWRTPGSRTSRSTGARGTGGTRTRRSRPPGASPGTAPTSTPRSARCTTPTRSRRRSC